MHKSNRRGASPPLLEHDLHAIDATPARWRGVVVYYRPFQPERAHNSLFDLRTGGKGGKGKGCYHCGGNHTRANCPELEPPIPEKVVLNFRDEAAYKAYLAKCDQERKASEDIAFRNHGEYIKYLTKIKEKEDDAHAAWAVTKAELDKKAQAEAELRAIDAALAKTRVSAPPKPPAAPPVAPAAPKPPPAPLPPPMSGAQKLAASPFSSAWGDSSDDD